jgi:hypothetical protein
MITTKSQAFKELLNMFSEVLSNAGCNDFVVENNPEMYAVLEQAAADNLGLTLEGFRASPDYEDYKPSVSADGKKIYTSDYTILAIIRKEMGGI